MKHVKQQPLLQVSIMSPAETLYEGPAVSVSAENKIGPFDVLAGHTNFFSMLLPCVITVNTGEDVHTFEITHGLMKVHDNTIVIFINIGQG